MTNLQRSIKAYRWNSQMESKALAAEIGITTRDYNRFEAGEPIDQVVFLAIIRWAFDDEPLCLPAKMEAQINLNGAA